MSKECECERLRTQLAGCLVAAEGGAGDTSEKDWGWSPAFEAVRKLHVENERLRGWIKQYFDGWWPTARRECACICHLPAATLSASPAPPCGMCGHESGPVARESEKT